MNYRRALYILLSFIISGLLFLYVYKGSDVASILGYIKNVDSFWFVVSAFLGFLAYLVRAYRWRIAMKPLGYHFSFLNSSLAVIMGYFINLFLPRLGEIMRCTILKKTNEVPIKISFGTVITERVVDMLFLIIFIGIAFLAQLKRIRVLINESLDFNFDYSKIILMFIVCLLLGTMVILILKKYHKTLLKRQIYRSIIKFLLGLKKGLLSVQHIDKINKVKYLISSFLIWVLYYFLFYAIFLCVPDIGYLSLEKMSFIFTMGCIGMVIPTPGGVGSFHLLVAASLGSYGLDKGTSNSIALILHAGQYLTLWVLGLISTLIIIIIINYKKRQPDNIGPIPKS